MLDQTTYDKTDHLAEVRRRAEASLEMKRNRREARGFATLSSMAGWGAFGGEEESWMLKASKAAKLFLIWFTFVTPILMVLYLR